METYEYQKNKAIVERMYYCERILQGSTFAATVYTGVNLMFMQRGYFAHRGRAGIPKVWGMWAVWNATIFFLLLKPLQRDEMAIQWRKRKIMGKWLYSMYHLEDPNKKDTA